MSLPQRQVTIRLTQELHARYEKLSNVFTTLQTSTLMRILLSASLRGELKDQIEKVQRELTHPVARPKHPIRPFDPNLNTQSR